MADFRAAFAALGAWYPRSGRAELPWRATRDPYAIVVSETMLQQTQVDRVRERFGTFLARWPNFAALAAATRADVVREWAGLGYNSRAVRLHALAGAVVARGGALPRERDELLALPGIGSYTASAVRAFAFEEPDVAVDVNARRVLHRLGYGIEIPPQARDAELRSAALAALTAANTHDVNSALMDLGATICTARAPKCLVCPLRAACVAAPLDAATIAAAVATRRRPPQAALPFERTNRFLRGRIVAALRTLGPAEVLSLDALVVHMQPLIPADRLVEIPSIVAALVRDGIVACDGVTARLA